MGEGNGTERFAVTPGVGSVFFSATQLAAISEVTGETGRVELNAFMQLIVEMPMEQVRAGKERLAEQGLGIYPVGAAVKNLHTCTFCMGERTEGLPDAVLLDELVAGTAAPFPVRIGFSGCSNNCGEALLRDIGVVRMGNGTYDIFVGGKAGSLTPVVGTRVAEGVAPEALPGSVQAILDCYRSGARGKERFWKAVQRLGVERFRAALP